MQKLNKVELNLLLIVLSMFGGYALSLTGTPIAWMIGSLLMAGLASTMGWLRLQEGAKGIHPYWRQIGQAILGIELGKNIKVSIMDTFGHHFFIILFMLFSSIAIAILSGIVLWRFSKASMLTCLFGSTPGGISAMPSIAEEIGANTIVVSLIQTLRILLVTGFVPLFAGMISTPVENGTSVKSSNYFDFHSLLLTGFFIIGAVCGAFIGKKIKLPAPWLVGSMLGTIVVQFAGTLISGDAMNVFWPPKMVILAQVLIGASIGSRIQREMFKGLGNVIMVGLMSSMGLVILMAACSFFISEFTHIPLVTCLLAFAPGGVAEMAATAVALNADSTFVVAVQSLRLMTILILLPPLFRFITKRSSIPIHKKKEDASIVAKD